MSSRTPTDGKPFYCKTCGLGWGEYGACEEPDCQLESDGEAQVRAALQNAQPQGEDGQGPVSAHGNSGRTNP